MRHRLIIFLLFISLPLYAQHLKEVSTLFFGNNTLNYEPMNTFFDGWYVTQGESKLDSTITYNKEKSLLFTSTASCTTQLFATYYISFDDIIDADSITFSCKYKLDPTNNAAIYFYINQRYNNPSWSLKRDTISTRRATPDLESIEEWQEFSTKEKIEPNIEGIFSQSL